MLMLFAENICITNNVTNTHSLYVCTFICVVVNDERYSKCVCSSVLRLLILLLLHFSRAFGNLDFPILICRVCVMLCERAKASARVDVSL